MSCAGLLLESRFEHCVVAPNNVAQFLFSQEQSPKPCLQRFFMQVNGGRDQTRSRARGGL